MVILSEAERSLIASEIEASEKATSGEICCVVAEASDNYREAPLAFGVLAAFLAPAVLLVVSAVQAPWYVGNAAGAAERIPLPYLVGLQAVVFLIVTLLASSRRVKMLIVPAGLKRERVRQRALEQFHAHNVHQTRARTGVVIFVSMSERMAELLADETIDRLVDRKEWQRPMQALTESLGTTSLAEGLTLAVRETGKILAIYAPQTGTDVNELSNSVVVLPDR